MNSGSKFSELLFSHGNLVLRSNTENQRLPVKESKASSIWGTVYYTENGTCVESAEIYAHPDGAILFFLPPQSAGARRLHLKGQGSLRRMLCSTPLASPTSHSPRENSHLWLISCSHGSLAVTSQAANTAPPEGILSGPWPTHLTSATLSFIGPWLGWAFSPCFNFSLGTMVETPGISMYMSRPIPQAGSAGPLLVSLVPVHLAPFSACVALKSLVIVVVFNCPAVSSATWARSALIWALKSWPRQEGGAVSLPLS